MFVVSAPGTLLTTRLSSSSSDRHRVERDLVDPVEIALTQLGDHRVGVGEVRERDGLGVGRLLVVPLPRDEDRRALLLVLLDRVGACRDDGQVLLRMERLQVLPVGADERLPDVLRDDEQLLQLGEHVADRSVVVDHERVLVRRLRAHHMPERGRRHRGRPGRELDDGVDRPGGIVGRERRPVRPRPAGLEAERPVLAVRRGLPGRGPVSLDDEAVVARRVLNELRVDHQHRLVGLRLDVVEGVERVDVVDRAHAEDSALDRSPVRLAGPCVFRGIIVASTGGDCDEQRQDCNHQQRSLPHASTLPLPPVVRPD